MLKAQQDAEEAGESEREASRLVASYTVPAYKILSTFLFATKVPATAIASFENLPPVATRARFKNECGCALWKLSDMGEEGGLAVKKEIAAYAGVQLTEFVWVPWSTVLGAARNIRMVM